LLFSEIEHTHPHELTSSPNQPELDLCYNNVTPNYYEPKWFSTNGKVQ
jgi:hypothetical protein